MGPIKRLLSRCIDATKPIVWRVARAYDIHIDHAFRADGEHPLVIEDGLELARGRIPKTVFFNTRSGSITVGSNTLFGEDVMVLTGKHLDVVSAKQAGVEHHAVPESGRDIVIGRGCYVGSRAIIVGPVKIGDYAVIGAGAVVTRDIPPYAFAVGSPARVVRELGAGAPASESRLPVP